MKRILFAAILLLIPIFIAGAQGLTPIVQNQANIESEVSTDEAEFEDEVYGTLTRRGGRLFLDGKILKKSDAKLVLGPELYKETYRGSRRQCRTANTLCTFGVMGVLGGAAAIVLAEVGRDNLLDTNDLGYTMQDYDDLEAIGYMAALCGVGLVNLSIPFASIGKSRLAWICDDYNERSSSRYTLNIGLQNYGYGLALKF